MEQLHPIIQAWFNTWETENIEQLPITSDFKHTSPFGVIETSEKYLAIVGQNKAAFLGNRFNIQEQIKEGDHICVRYELINKDKVMPVCEWFVIEGELIKEVYSYYNIGNAQITG